MYFKEAEFIKAIKSDKPKQVFVVREAGLFTKRYWKFYYSNRVYEEPCSYCADRIHTKIERIGIPVVRVDTETRG
jgi:hypothetical protein